MLVLTPTRELAQQVAKATATYGRHVQGLRVATVLGGVPYAAQLKALRGPLDVLIATPGRLIDHVQSGKCVLDHVEMLVLDEADRMLDMGFIDDIRFIAECTPKTRQTVMYSATFAGHVGHLAAELLRNPLAIEVASHTDTHANIEQRLHWADHGAHKDALLDHLLADREVEQALVFTSTQRDADDLADRLAEFGHRVASLHGGMPQGRRNRVLDGLRRGHLRVLVATDVAARGIDVPTISHVINYGLPMKAEDYVHRIGRTGRAGRSGLAVTLAEARDAGMLHRARAGRHVLVVGRGSRAAASTTARRISTTAAQRSATTGATTGATTPTAPAAMACAGRRRTGALRVPRGLTARRRHAAAAADAAGRAARRARRRRVYTPSSSTSNISVAFGGITPPAPRAP